ncbi:MAG: DUF4410 domain-containing protein [Methylacidiphilales bacterium]|nr:DUF4410 domain-containing protein [Candidatus Methylacidiphilales bacterium]
MRFPIPVLWAGVLVVLAGCASTGVGNKPQPPPPTVAAANIRPDAIYVYDFHMDLSTVKMEGKRGQLVQFREQLRTAVTRRLVELLNREVLPAYPYGKDLPLPTGNFWLIDGRLFKVDETNQALSLSLGNGPGQHTSEAYVEFAALNNKTNPERLMIFDTSGQPYAFKLEAENPNAALDKDAARIARLVTDFLKSYFVKQGWIAAPASAAPTKAPQR